MRIDTIPWSHSNPLANAYIQCSASIEHRFNGFPSERSAWDSRIAYLSERPLSADRKQLASLLYDYNRSIGNQEAAFKNIEALESPDSLVVIGGQQSGLFTGPLLVIYKAITIIRQAREAAKRYDRPVIPVFWIAGEDHDFAEVDHVHVLQSDLQIHKIQLDKQDNDRISISHLGISPESWERVIRELTTLLPDTDNKPDFLSKLCSLCRDSHTLSEAFARIMAWLFGDEGLVLVDSADPALRKLESPMWQQLLQHNEQLQHAYQQGKDDLIRSGYTPQADVHPNGANLFYYHSGNRMLLYRQGNVYTDRSEQVRLSHDQIMHIAEHEPDKLSNNVLTRPLMQDYVFPVLAVVLGPGEIAYWGQIKEAFGCLRMELPIIIPREGYTLVETPDQKALVKYGLSIEDAMRHLPEKRDLWLKSQDTLGLEDEFVALEERIRTMYEPLMDKASRINPVMKQLGETNRAKVIEQVKYYRSRVMGEIESRNEVGLRQFERLSASLNPTGVPQERFYNAFYYLNRYGNGWLHSLIHDHQPDPYDSRHHYVVFL